MAAHACCGGGVAAGAARPSATSRRLKSRRPSSTRSTLMKAIMKRRKAAAGGGKRATSRKQRVTVIRRKMEALRRLVPAACGADGERVLDDGRRLEELLLHAAGYIMRLQMQVRVMQVMVHALNHPEDY